jgi:hypothetical protein
LLLLVLRLIVLVFVLLLHPPINIIKRRSLGWLLTQHLSQHSQEVR